MSMRDWALQIAPITAIGVVLAASAGTQDAGSTQKSGIQPQIRSSGKDPGQITAAAHFTPWGKVLSLQTGWNIDRMLMFHDVPTMTNPDACPLETNGYVVSETHSSRNLFNTLLLSALLNGREVSLVVSGCYEDRPQIISAAIR